MLPVTLENRLADQYKNIAEDIRHEQRLWQVSGDMKEQEGRAVFDVYVDKGLASATFAVNWANRYTAMRMELRSPSGRLYKPGDRDVVYRSDQTMKPGSSANPRAVTGKLFCSATKLPPSMSPGCQHERKSIYNSL